MKRKILISSIILILIIGAVIGWRLDAAKGDSNAVV